MTREARAISQLGLAGKFKAKLLENWAGSHVNQVKSLLHFTGDHFYSFGGKAGPTGSTITTAAGPHGPTPVNSASLNMS